MIRLYLIALVTSFLASLAATPASMALARRFGAMDAPDPRKVHSEPKPRWGGIGVVAGVLVGLFTAWYFFPEFDRILGYSYPVMRGGRVLLTIDLGDQLAGILFGMLVLFGVGLADDRKPVPAGMKLTLQIIAAYVAMTYGVRIQGLSVPGFEAYAQFPLWFMQLVTVLWLVGLCNAVNLIDGLDGLASGVVAIVSGAFVAVTLIQTGAHSALYSSQMHLAGIFAVVLFGALLAFLVYNFNPAHVFLGDSGSLTIGFLLACVAVIGAFKTTILFVVVLPLVLVALPVADMTVAFGRRLISGKSPFSPDRGHFHHRLLDAGWTQREVVLLVYVVTLALAFVSITAVAVRQGA